MLMRRICGEKSSYLTDLGRIRFYPSYAPASEESKSSSWASAIGKIKNLVNIIKEEIVLFEGNAQPVVVAGVIELDHVKTKVSRAPRVFIVHGRDELAKVSAARFVEKLGLTAVILHEQVSGGKTIIEKIEEHTNVGFALVLYTPCDATSSARQKLRTCWRWPTPSNLGICRPVKSCHVWQIKVYF